MTIPASLALLALLVSAPAQEASATACELSPGIHAELAKAANVARDPSDFDKNVGPLLALRERHRHDLLVHELYQDTVQRYGIEGHLRKLTEEYQLLSMQHSDELMYDYLYARSLIGRNTPSAIREITKLVADHPDFAPGHASLAEIYASAAFRNDEKEKVERERFVQLCPGSTLQPRPGPLAEPSPLVDRAESLLAGNGDPDRIMAMAQQGIRDDERRLQRIRPFDWYSVEYKRQSQRELQSKYWRMWSIEVRCDRRAGRPEKAAQVLAAMDQRATLLAGHSDPVYWETLAMLARLYHEGNQEDSATQKLDSMRRYLVQHPDPRRTAELEELRKQLAAR
jgi:hypothetical protein